MSEGTEARLIITKESIACCPATRFCLTPKQYGRYKPWKDLFRHCTENVVYKLSLLVVHILKRYSRVLTSFAVQLDFFSNDWSVSFTFAFIWSNVFSPLNGTLSVASMFTISTMSSILTISSNALMLQIDKLNGYDQNFISFKIKKTLRIAKKEKPKPLTVLFHLSESNLHRGSDYYSALTQIPVTVGIV